MKIIKKTAFLFILMTAMTAGAFAQRGGDKPKDPPPPKPDRPVVVPKPKPDPPKDKPKKPEYAFYAISQKTRQELA